MERLFAVAAGSLPCLMFAGFAVLAGVLIAVGIWRARKRREAMTALARRLGLAFYPSDPWNLPVWYGRLELFGRGRSRRAENVMSGEIDGRTVVAFDYRYTTGSGKNKHTHYFQVVVWLLPIQAPGLRLRPENLLDRVASWVGWDDIDFESDEFSRRYHVACEDRRFAYDIFHARLIDYLLRCGSVPSMEMNGVFLALYEPGLGGPERVERLLAIGRTVIDMIPGYVLRARGVEAAAGGSVPGRGGGAS